MVDSRLESVKHQQRDDPALEQQIPSFWLQARKPDAPGTSGQRTAQGARFGSQACSDRSAFQIPPRESLPELVRRLKVLKVLRSDETLKSATTYRFLNSLPAIPSDQVDDADRRKFEAEYPNQLWQSDVCHGPKILSPRGTHQKTYLFVRILAESDR